MNNAKPHILTLNGGSSSIRFAVYEIGDDLLLRLDGKIDRIGLSNTHLIVNDLVGKSPKPQRLGKVGREVVVDYLLDWLEAQPLFTSLVAVGHRVVHGMKHSEPSRITAQLMAELRGITAYDPEHLPREIELIEALTQRHPKLPQIACFDTAFHRDMPNVAKLLPIPRRYAAKGVERYGFHGLSYAYLIEELGRLDPVAAKGRVILAHLGNGASMAAVRDGKSIDTSMGFTSAAGLVMSTRSGDLDPGLIYYLFKTQGMTVPQFQHMVNHESGLLGISAQSSDMGDLLALETSDTRAAEAVELFCYQARKWIGAYSAALGGLDTLVFAGGIGENAALIRQRICANLGFLGIKLNQQRNRKHASLISTDDSHTPVRVIRTDEALMIARSVARIINCSPIRKK